MNRSILTAFAILAFTLAGPARAQDYSKVDIRTTDLGHGLYMLQGSGGNITVAVGEDGVIMVDSEFAPLHDKIKAAIAAVTKLPVRYLIDTHFHPDHTGGNAAFAREGAIVVAQENVKPRMATPPTNALTGITHPPAPPEALPTQTYDKTLVLRIKGRTARLSHIALAHTDGDTVVYFKDGNVLASGDIVDGGGLYPNIEISVGGNIDGMIAGTDVLLKIVNDTTKIVPGHGPLMTKAKLKDYRAMLATIRNRIAALIKSGKTMEEAVAARPLADFDAKGGNSEQDSAKFVKLVYLSLKPGK